MAFQLRSKRKLESEPQTESLFILVRTYSVTPLRFWNTHGEEARQSIQKSASCARCFPVLLETHCSETDSSTT
ncbi:unnamed protein product [Acanthoscelides obtectus]|uniref:Uncharacterized protein n=1 Tax=Acanthoscelides obtectus TaxID=200917 RepID=A0A9P0PVC7_ACAOB|nr:unnamed protein product [Acanthoscelides obtectus]CAK1652775.1 hypothetical protein AOBTE_LOCUS17907 [Acanthoscelides obtectus]